MNTPKTSLLQALKTRTAGTVFGVFIAAIGSIPVAHANPDDVAFAHYLVKEVGVAAVPGSSFYRHAELGRTKLRFCFCKRDATLAEADRRLASLRPSDVRA